MKGHGRISRAVSGNLFFAPTPDFLEDAAE